LILQKLWRYSYIGILIVGRGFVMAKSMCDGKSLDALWKRLGALWESLDALWESPCAL